MSEREFQESVQRVGVIVRKMAQDIQDGIRKAFAEIADGLDSAMR